MQRDADDAIGIAEDPLEASVQVFLVRKGRVVGRKGLVVDKVEDVSRAELVGRLLEQLYGDAGPDDVPREILVPAAPDETGAPEPVAWKAPLRYDIRMLWFAGGNYLNQVQNVNKGVAALKKVEAAFGKKFGDPSDPLLVSVRSGAALSMPGMMSP